MVSASATTFAALSNMLRSMYAISRLRRSDLEFSYCSKKWLTFGAFRVHQKALVLPRVLISQRGILYVMIRNRLPVAVDDGM